MVNLTRFLFCYGPQIHKYISASHYLKLPEGRGPYSSGPYETELAQ